MRDLRPQNTIIDNWEEEPVIESDESDDDVAGPLESESNSDVEDTHPVWGKNSTLKDLKCAAAARGLSKTGSKSQILEQVCHHDFAGDCCLP